ncbi:transmembrane protein, putative (macronuclear) [Tetrahymena thermophila SB210]|uniref:Transmembrane protein, putative n=1 Tax=Tetrahymena thermophila (strain SB210) TaxID=312017 RepID=I7M759_TETTS|nr:transmembrane protein, putative [Tetrahymena thermophila SB210]EAR89911.2 transmembrane protein, putative [Tetrahymena thermophila SB210]|eukprot:XP_001010156.2 transmembrane protein, putative [Tetrahymena thermophila SB210]
MLTFGDSQTEPSSTEEEKKKNIKNLNKSSKELSKNYTRELTRDSDGQEQQNRALSDTNSEQANIDTVKDSNKRNNNSNTGIYQNQVNGFEAKSFDNSQQAEANNSEQQTIKLNIMSPKVNRQIKYANFEDLTNQQNQKEIIQAKHVSREDTFKNSNMIKREIQQQQHINSSNDLFVDDFSISKNIFQFIILQLMIIFEIVSTMFVSSIFFSEDLQYSLIIYISLFFLLGLASVILPKIQKLRKHLIQIMTFLRFIVLIIYIEGRVIGMYSSLERNINNQIKSQVNHAVEMLNQDKQQQDQTNINYQILNSRYLFTQAVYIGCLLICLISTSYKSASNFLGSTKNAILTIITILYVQLRLCDFSEISLVQISLTFFLVVTVFITLLFQNYIVFFLFKSLSPQQNILGIQNQDSNQNPSFIVSPRFGEIQTNQQNEVNQEQIINYNLKNLSIQKAARLYGINYQNEGESQRQSGQDLDDDDNNNNNNIQNIQNLNFLSPKNNIGSLQIITPRDELDSKREMYNEIQKQGINLNQNGQQEQFSPTDDNHQNNNNIKYSSNRQVNCQNDVFFKVQSDQKIGSDTFNQEKYQNDIQPNEESMRKSINFYDEQISDNNQFEKQMQENYNNNEEYDIQDNELPDQSLFEGDKSDMKVVTDHSTIQINPNKKELSPVVQVEAEGSEEQTKWKILKQARDALQIRKKLEQQQNKLKVYNNMTQKNGLEKQILDLEQRLEMQDMILNNISNGIIIIQKDTNEVVYVNKQACQNLNCSLEQVFNTLMSLKNVNTLKDEVSNFSELLQQFDHPIQLSQLSTLKGLFINHDKQREIMICIQPDSFQSHQNQLEKRNLKPGISNQAPNNQMTVDKNATNFTLKNYLDQTQFLQIEVDQVRNQKQRYMVFNINIITWNNPYNVIHTTTLKIQYFIRKMISELSLDINDIREYFQAVNNQSIQKLDCNGCIGKVDCMSEFLQDFATSSLLISSTFIPIKQQLNLQHLIQSVLEKMKIRSSSKQYYFSLQYDSVCPQVVYSDVKRLDRVFYNLILYFIDTNDKAYIKIKVLPSFSNSTPKKKLKIQIICSKSQTEDTPTNSSEAQGQKKKINSGVKFSLSQKKAQITNVYMLENMHYGVLLSNSIIQKLEPDDQGIVFQSGSNTTFTFQLSI